MKLTGREIAIGPGLPLVGSPPLWCWALGMRRSVLLPSIALQTALVKLLSKGSRLVDGRVSHLLVQVIADKLPLTRIRVLQKRKEKSGGSGEGRHMKPDKYICM